MKVKLTETIIRNAVRNRPPEGITDFADTFLTGLHLRIYKTGSASWVLLIRDKKGDLRRIKLGEYPAMGIAGAHEAARRMRVDVRGGADPIRAAKMKRNPDPNATLAALVERYAARPKKKPNKSWPEAKRCLEGVFKVHLSEAVESLTRRQLQDTADKHRASGSASAAVRYLRPVLKWAIEKDEAPAELASIKEPVKVGKRERVLTEAELTVLLPAIWTSTDPHRRAMTFMLLTLARREEVCSARWQHIDLAKRVWTIPTTKSGRQHEVPLSDQATTLLRSLGSGDPDALVFQSARGSHLDNWDRETKKLLVAVGLAAVKDKKVVMKDGSIIPTRHDLRRTGTTMLGDAGTPPHVLEAALNHAVIHSELAGRYNKSHYRPQVAEALQALADMLNLIASKSAVPAPGTMGGDLGQTGQIVGQGLVANQCATAGLAEG